MNVSDIPLMAMLKSKLGYISQRQTLIAQNVANADTPEYSPRDLKPFSVEQALAPAQNQFRTVLARTSPGHLAMDDASASDTGGPYDIQTKDDSEVRLDGNHVVLEEQMMKLNAAGMDYNAAIGFYEQSMSMLRTAIKKPGS